MSDLGPFASLPVAGQAAAASAAAAEPDLGPFASLPIRPPGFFTTVGQSFKRGLAEGGQEVADTATGPFRDRQRPAHVPDAIDKAAEGLHLLSPTWYGANIARGLGQTAPSLATGAAGALAGGALAGPPGAIVGGALGFGGGAAGQSLSAAYQRAIAEGLDHEAAKRRAYIEAGIHGATGAAAAVAPAVPIFGRVAGGALARPGAELATQVFGAQPAIGAVDQLATGAAQGRMPTGEEMVRGAVVDAATGAVLSAPYLAHNRRGRPGTPTAAEPASVDPQLFLPSPAIRMPDETRPGDAFMARDAARRVSEIMEPHGLARFATGNAVIGGRSSVEGVHPEFAARIERMVADMPPDIAARFKITSGFRDAQRQAEVNPAVKNSRHGQGMAVDTTTDPAVLAWINANGARHGVGYPLRADPKEANHLEPLEGGARIPGGIVDAWAGANGRIIGRGEQLALPPPQRLLPRPETTYGDDFLMRDTKPEEPQRLLPKPSTIYGEGFTANGEPLTGTPLDRLLYGVARLEPGDPVTRRLIARLAGVSQDQAVRLRDRLVNQGLIRSESGRYTRAATVNPPETFAPPAIATPINQIPSAIPPPIAEPAQPAQPAQPASPLPEIGAPLPPGVVRRPAPAAEPPATPPPPIASPLDAPREATAQPAPPLAPFRSVRGATDQAFVPSTGAALPVEYAVIDARRLVTSHHDDLSPNSDYPQALQPRNRERAETEAQLAGILNGDPRDPDARFRPELMGENADAANGSPIVGPEGFVESGNARTMAIRRAYDRGLPQAEEYRQHLAAQGYPIEGVEQPVLVRVNRAGLDMPQREQLARDLNVAPQATMSATDRAMADAQQIRRETLQAYQGGDTFSATNKPFWRGILDRIAKTSELPALTNPEGGLSPAGETRIRNALLAKAYGDPDIIAALTENPDSNIKGIGKALGDVAPRWAMLREAVAAGDVAHDYDLTSPLLEAVRLVAHARDTGRNVAEFVNQRGMFGDGVKPETEGVLAWMLGAPEWTRRYSQQKVADTLTEYADSVMRPLRLGETRPAPAALRENAREVAHGAAGDLFASPLGEPGRAEAVRPRAGDVGPEAQGSRDDTAGPAAPGEGGGRQQRPGASSDAAPAGPVDRAALRDELYRLVKERAPTLRLRTMDELVGTIEGRPSPIHGSYRTEARPGGLLDHVASIALGGPDPRAALSHEIVHFLRRAGLLTRAEWGILANKADKWAEQFGIGDRYGDQSPGIKREEAIAEAYAAWDKGDMPMPPGLRRIFGKVKDFFTRTGNWLRGQGFQTAEDVFGRMSSGEVGRREGGAPAATGEPLHARPRAPEDERVRAALDQIRVAPDDRPLWQRALDMMKTAKTRVRDEVRYAMIDSFDPVLAIEKAGNAGRRRDASVSAFTAAHQSRELPSMMSAVVGIPDGQGGYLGGVPMLKAGAYVTNPDSAPLSAGFKPIFDAGRQDAYELWWAVNRGKRLLSEGRERLITPEIIAAHRNDHLRPENLGPNGENLFLDAQRQWIKFNKHVLDFGEQTGLVNQEQRAMWERGDYVPFLRSIGVEENPLGPGRGARGIANQSSGIKQLLGGTEKLNSLYENAYLVSEAMIARGLKNEAARRTRDLAEPLGAMHKVSLAEQMASKGKRSDDIVSVMEGGKHQYYRVTDPLLYKAITAFGPVEANKIVDWIGLPKRFLTKMVTHEPTFMAANLMRDTLHAWVVTGADFKPGFDTMKGAAAALRNSPSAMAIMAGGGGGPHWYGKGAKGFVRDLNGEWTALNTHRKLWDALERVGSAGEQANRIAIYESALKGGATHAEAVWQAKDMLNFTAQGGGELMKFLAQTVPFMNARVQGLDRLQRGVREKPASFLLRGGLVTAASMALWALNKDNPDYQRLPDFEKQAYWHLFLPGFSLRIPKPFEVGAIFGSIPEMLGDFVDNGNQSQLWHAFAENLIHQLNLSPIPQAFGPALDVRRNVRSLTGGPIVNEAEQNLLPGERFGPNTSATMTALGQQIGISPDQLEYLFKGYSGTIGSYILAGTDLLTDAASGTTRPDIRIERVPFVGRFIRTEPALANRWINGFYDVKEEVGQLHATMSEMAKQGRAAEAQELVRDNLEKFGLYPATQAIGAQLGAIRKAMKVVNDAPGMTGTEKRERLDQLIAARNAIGDQSGRRIVERARP